MVWAAQVALVVKYLPANAGKRDIRDTVRCLGEEDPLEEGTTTHLSILAWRIPETEEPGRLKVYNFQVFPWKKSYVQHRQCIKKQRHCQQRSV